MIGQPVRSIRLAAVFAFGITLLAVPAASADEGFVIPAGLGCSFDVHVVQGPGPDAGGDHTGDHNPVGSANIIFTNQETGVTYLQKSYHLGTETYDPDTNTLQAKSYGRSFMQFWPGDQGPNGLVEEPGLLLAFSGTFQFTVDVDTEIFLSFSHQGTYVDICAELSE